MTGNQRRETDAAAHHPPGENRAEPIERTAQQARQGEIVLGREARWILAACIILFLLAAVILGPWW